MKVNKCPWCEGNAKIQTRRTDRSNTRNAVHRSQVVCNRCKTRGPLCEMEEEAISKWNFGVTK